MKGQAGNDGEIEFSRRTPSRLRQAVQEFQPRILCFNGKRAAREFLQAPAVAYWFCGECVGSTRLFVAPSTSGAARAWWDASVWQDLADCIKE